MIALAVAVVFVACGSAPTSTPLPFRGQWIILVDETDPLTRVGEVDIRLRQNDAGRFPALYIRCREDEFNLYELDFLIAWSETPITTRNAPWETTVQHRIDDGPIESLDWIYSTNYTATFLPSRETSRIIEELFNANEFVVRIETDESDTITAKFEPAGIYWAVKPVLAACEVEIDQVCPSGNCSFCSRAAVRAHQRGSIH